MKMTLKMEWVKGLVFFLILVGTPSIVHAELEDILSKFKAYISMEEQYDSNINLVPSSDVSVSRSRDDFITVITPGIRFSTQSKSPITGEFPQAPTAEDRFGLNVDFNMGFNFYAKNHDENYISLNGTLNGWYALSQKLNFRVRDYIIRSNDIYEPNYSSTAIPGENLPSRTRKRVIWFRNVFEPSLQYQFGREDFFNISYQSNVYNVQSPLYEDSVGNSVNANINYWFDIRNGVSLSYSLGFANYQHSPEIINPSPDSVSNTVTGRYTYRFNPNTSIFLNYTQSWVNYKRSGINLENPANDYVVYTPTIGITHAFSSTLSGSFQFGYYWSVPKFGSTVSAPSYALILTQQGEKTTYSISFQGGYTQDLLDAQNRGFTQYNRAIGRITYQLLQRMNVGGFASYEWDKYPRPVLGGRGQTDNIWAIGCNANYQILKWLTLALDFSYRQDNSNIPENDYTDYRGIFRITATY